MKRRTAIASAVLALGLVGGGVGAAVPDVPVLAWQRFGPADKSLQPTERGLNEASVERGQIGADKTILLKPKVSNGELVIWFHGYKGSAEDILGGAPIAGLRDSLLDAGYTITASDAAGDDWGSKASVESYTAVDAWASARVDVTSRVLVGQSMGGLASLQMLKTLPAVSAWVGIYPVCDVASVTLPAAPDTPNLSPVDLSAADGVRMLFFHSPSDTVVPRDRNTDQCAEAAEQAGAEVEVVRVFGDHSNQSAYQPDKVLDFLRGA